MGVVARIQKYCKENLSDGKFDIRESAKHALSYLQKPQVIFIMVLVFVVIMLSTQYSSLQKDMNKISHKLNKFNQKENYLLKKLSKVRNEMK